MVHSPVPTVLETAGKLGHWNYYLTHPVAYNDIHIAFCERKDRALTIREAA
jgi:hypothetical protein